MPKKYETAILFDPELPEEQRKDFYLYIDEFHNFTALNIPEDHPARDRL